MIEVLKAFLIVIILAILAYPLLPFSSKAKKFSTFYALRYDCPHNRKNLPFIFLTILEFLVVALLFGIIFKISDFAEAIPFVEKMLNKISPKLKFDAIIMVGVLLVNFVIIYSFVFLN